ncbi:NnrU family protein [Methylobacterium nodulans]|uniref:NnrUfamily protein n=1 Tax=Methylobacterium nodulans (strain LMG 21967 / CNCM I-2342 / ORS 2060) TaxID=460265 RepID=B8IEB8_METNO|nr:NnrU family protein [Methylobacterium nodulans]ACL59490.1 NnrUfamily protein [Methylobacterium nodulans ORS 2060]
MLVLVLGLVLFLGTHAFTMLRGPRARLIERIGEAPYKIGYSLLSLAGLIVIGIGFGQYRQHGYVELWSPPVWTRHLALVLVLVAFVAVVAAYLPGRIRSTLKHPMLAGVKIWAVAHLLANGDLGSILLFGSILAWAVAARISAKRRDEVKAHAGPAAAPAGWRNDALAVGIGAVAWFVFARVLHPWLIGVAVWPGQA